jgi:phage-related protein
VDKVLVWMQSEVKSPPLSRAARIEVGVLLRRLQRGESLGLPQSRPMPTVGARCHELRVRDQGSSWRLVYRVDVDAVVIAAVFQKQTRATPTSTLDVCRRRLHQYDSVVKPKE